MREVQGNILRAYGNRVPGGAPPGAQRGRPVRARRALALMVDGDRVTPDVTSADRPPKEAGLPVVPQRRVHLCGSGAFGVPAASLAPSPPSSARAWSPGPPASAMSATAPRPTGSAAWPTPTGPPGRDHPRPARRRHRPGGGAGDGGGRGPGLLPASAETVRRRGSFRPRDPPAHRPFRLCRRHLPAPLPRRPRPGRLRRPAAAGARRGGAARLPERHAPRQLERAPARRAGPNGTFNAFRVLGQDVAAFEDFLAAVEADQRTRPRRASTGN